MRAISNPAWAAPAAQQAAPGFPKHVIPAIIVIYACMLPRELTVNVLGIAFQPFRIVLVGMFPLLVLQGLRLQVRPSLVDFLVVIAAIWAMVALSVTEWVISALKTGLAEGLNFFLAYFAGRVSIRNGRDFKAIVPVLLPGLVICSLTMIAESLSHTLLLRPALGSLLNFPADYFYDVRFGLMRGTGPFPHPILAGVFLASFAPLVWYLLDRPLHRALGFLGVSGVVFTFSSTAFVGFFASVGLIAASCLQRLTRLPIFVMLAAGGFVAAAGISLISEGGLFSFLIRRLTLASSTGYYRMAIWEHAGAEVLANPIFGIGTRDYTRPAWMISSSVDAHWLLITMRYGFPFSIAVFATIVCGIVMCLRSSASPDPVDHKVGRAMAFSLIAIIVTGLSVYLWEGVEIWMTLLTGMAVSFGQYLARWRQVGSQTATYAQPYARRYA
jgi:hypothetical protein